jgi:ArsR family transcriptional regulator, lead/cadmium/zinc/bismuth-responsive transcriptional repressor
MLIAKEISKIKKRVSKSDNLLPNIFAVLGDRNRFQIIKLLIRHGKICVSDLASILNVSVSAISQHLRILEMSGLVECERMGQMMCYKTKTDDPNIKRIIDLM